MGGGDFYLKLVNETFETQNQRSKERKSSFEKTLVDLQLLYFKGSYLPHNQIIRFESLWGLLDFPSSFPLFDCYQHQFKELHSENDSDCLYAVLSQSWDQKISHIYATVDEGFYYLIAFKSDEGEKKKIVSGLISESVRQAA